MVHVQFGGWVNWKFGIFDNLQLCAKTTVDNYSLDPV